MEKQLLVIGGGAAGFFCAVNAARMNPQLKVMLLEKTGKLLSKVKVSGGGRCNVTHACFDIAMMSKKYPRGAHFVKKSFHRFITTDTISWFEERGVKLKTEADGRMFPVTDSSQTIIDCLLKEADKYGVQISLHTSVQHIIQEGDGFRVQLAGNRTLYASHVCIACGGFPKASMFDWIRETGHTIEEPVPSLFTFNLFAGQVGKPGHPICELMGVSVAQARVKIAGTRLEQEGPLLITHWGLSGPAVLKLSAWGARELAASGYAFTITVNWLPAFTEAQLSERFQSLRYEIAAQHTGSRNPFGLPQRLWEFMLRQTGISTERRWADVPAKDINKLAKYICNGSFEVRGKTTFKDEFVTAGGVKLSEVDPNTMMSRRVPGLYFAGEILDVDGVTGGFNFQHAWTSGWVAAMAISS